MEENGIEMSKSFKRLPMGSTDAEIDEEMSSCTTKADATGIPVPKPFEWAESQVRTQNRCFALVFLAMMVATAVYFVGGVYNTTGDEDGLVGNKYDAQGGIVSDNFDSAKAQETFEKSKAHQNKKNGHAGANNGNGGIHNGGGGGLWKNHNGKENPFGNQNALPHGNGNGNGNGNKNDPSRPHSPKEAAEARWNRTHPGEPYPRNGVFGKHGGAIGKNNHGGNSNSNNHQPGGKKHNNNNNNNNNNHQGGNNNKPNKCDLSMYKDWLLTNITKADGQKYEVIEQMDHDQGAFTQGLTFARGRLWESTGLYGHSTVRILNPNTADVVKSVPMEATLFGEGMTFYKGNKLIQITWKSRRGFIYNASSLEMIDEFKYETTKTEGWGITWDRCDDELIVTDGSEYLHFWDPDTMAEKRKIAVHRQNGKPAKELNEIEFWRGRVLANIWYEDVLLVIDPKTGTVEKEYNFNMLWPKSARTAKGADVFNGISVSSDPDVLYVTGKKWNRIYKIKLLA